MLLHHEAEEISAWINDWAFDPTVIAPPFLLLVGLIALVWDPDAISATFAALVATSPVWLPLALFFMFWKRWMHYIRFGYWFNRPMVLLKIELPQQFERTPLAMELILTGLFNNGSETTFIQRIWKGQFRAVLSFELVSNGGRIGYYIHMPLNWKDFAEARIYGQFPEARITVAEDYVTAIGYSPETHDLWGTEYKKGVADAVPLRTYINWGLDKNPDKPEQQIDPLVNILEFLSSIGPNEHVWIQFVAKARKKDEWHGFYLKDDHYKKDGQKAIKEIFEGAVGRIKEQVKDETAQKSIAARGAQLLSQPEKDRIEAIERNFSKLIYECGIRGVYINKKGSFNITRINNLVTLFNPFTYPEYNRLHVTRGMSIFDYPWQDWRNIRREMIRKRLFFWYRHRAYFYVPYDQDPVMLTTEELASVWHFPSQGVKTPGLERVGARVAEAPPNIPTGTFTLPGQ